MKKQTPQKLQQQNLQQYLTSIEKMSFEKRAKLVEKILNRPPIIGTEAGSRAQTIN